MGISAGISMEIPEGTPMEILFEISDLFDSIKEFYDNSVGNFISIKIHTEISVENPTENSIENR